MVDVAIVILPIINKYGIKRYRKSHEHRVDKCSAYKITQSLVVLIVLFKTHDIVIHNENRENNPVCYTLTPNFISATEQSVEQTFGVEFLETI